MSDPDPTKFTTLRAVEPGDLEFTRLTRSDPEVFLGTLGRRFPTTPDGEERWYESLGNGRFPTSAVWCIVDGSGDKVGLVQLDEIDWIHRTTWFGIWVAPTAAGRGHGRRATESALTRAYEMFELRQVRLQVLADNHAARSIYDSLGFVVEGTLFGAATLPDGVKDIVIMRHDRSASVV